MRIARYSLCFLAFLLAACSLTAPRDVGNANRITLNTDEMEPISSRKQGVLKVDYPAAPDDLDTFRIAVAKVDGGQDYIARARWNEFLPSVVQSALIEAFTHSGVFSFVEPDEGGVANTHTLHANIEHFTVTYTAGNASPKAHIRMVFRLMDAHAKKAITTFTLDKETQASGNTLTAIAEAFNDTFASIAREACKRMQKKLNDHKGE